MTVETVDSTYIVTGLNCSGCVSNLTRKAMSIYGVVFVDVALVPKGESSLLVRHARELDDRTLGVCLQEAGYTVRQVVSA